MEKKIFTEEDYFNYGKLIKTRFILKNKESKLITRAYEIKEAAKRNDMSNLMHYLLTTALDAGVEVPDFVSNILLDDKEISAESKKIVLNICMGMVPTIE